DHADLAGAGRHREGANEDPDGEVESAASVHRRSPVTAPDRCAEREASPAGSWSATTSRRRRCSPRLVASRFARSAMMQRWSGEPAQKAFPLVKYAHMLTPWGPLPSEIQPRAIIASRSARLVT